MAVYLKRGATQILASVLGNIVYSGKSSEYVVSSWDERAALIKKLTAEREGVGLEGPKADRSFVTPPHSPLRRRAGGCSSRTELILTTPIDVGSREEQDRDKKPAFTAIEKDQLSSTLRLSQPKKAIIASIVTTKPLTQCRSVRAVSASLSGALHSKLAASSAAKSQDDIMSQRVKTSPKTLRFPRELSAGKRLIGGDLCVEKRLTQLASKRAIISSNYVLQLPTIAAKGDGR